MVFLDEFILNCIGSRVLLEKNVFVLFGPTATGKTGFAIQLAKKINAEIINCDMAQIYSKIKIGTGQIKKEDKEGVEHHLFGFLNTPISISVYAMREKIELLIAIILAKGKKVILVGGSSFCVYSLFFAPSKINKSDSFSSKGSLEEATVFTASIEFKKKKDCILFLPRYDYYVIFFDFQRSKKEYWLTIVKERIKVFLLEGWLEEIKGLSSDWLEFLKKKKFIGYNELIVYLAQDDLSNLDFIKELIYFRTCQYGKKQRTFARKMKKDFNQYGVSYLEYFF